MIHSTTSFFRVLGMNNSDPSLNRLTASIQFQNHTLVFWLMGTFLLRTHCSSGSITFNLHISEHNLPPLSHSVKTYSLRSLNFQFYKPPLHKHPLSSHYFKLMSLPFPLQMSQWSHGYHFFVLPQLLELSPLKSVWPAAYFRVNKE